MVHMSTIFHDSTFFLSALFFGRPVPGRGAVGRLGSESDGVAAASGGAAPTVGQGGRLLGRGRRRQRGALRPGAVSPAPVAGRPDGDGDAGGADAALRLHLRAVRRRRPRRPAPADAGQQRDLFQV